MKTKSEIVKSLLEEKKIDIDEAMVLLMGNEKEIQFIPYPQPYPQPFYPSNPLPQSPIYSFPPNISAGHGTGNPTITVVNAWANTALN